MSKCDKCQEKLSLYIDNYLNDEETRELEEHLNECPECQKELIELQETMQLFKTLKNEEINPPIEMRAEIRKRIEAQIPQGSLLDYLKKMPWKVLTPLASAALIMIFILSSPTFGPTVINQASEDYANQEDSSPGNLEDGKSASSKDLKENKNSDDKNKDRSPLDFFRNTFDSVQNIFSAPIAVNDKNEKIKKNNSSIKDNIKDKIAIKQEQSKDLKEKELVKKKDQEVKQDDSDKTQSIALNENEEVINSNPSPNLRMRTFDHSVNNVRSFQLEAPQADLTQKIATVVGELDGKVTNQSTYVYDQNNNLEASKLTINIAENNLDETMNRLKQIGTVKTNSKKLDDKKEESNKLKSEIESLRVKEKELAKSGANEELSKVKQQIKNTEKSLKEVKDSPSIVSVDLEVKEKS